ncbi:muellerian-inhibiting factor [Rhinophrynus dorsalis]
MGVIGVGWWLLMLPMLCQTLPSKAGKKIQRRTAEDWKAALLSEDIFSQPIQNVKHEASTEDQQRPVCGIQVNGGTKSDLGKLEIQGALRDYDREFLNAVRRELWEAGDVELFGMCPEERAPAAQVALKHLAAMFIEPQGKHLVVLHMDKVEWETGAHMQFLGTVQEHVSPLLQHLHSLMLVFYPGAQKSSRGHQKPKILVSGEGIPQGQKRIVHQRNVNYEHEAERLALSETEAQGLLFGTDKTCFTKMTPVLFMVIGGTNKATPSLLTSQSDQINPGSSPQVNLAIPPAEKKDAFLETLSLFSALLLSFHGKATSSIHLPLDPNDDSVGDLRPQLFNVTNVEALEWLVESHVPLVFLFLPGSKYLLGTRALQGQLVGKLLEKMTEKLQEVLEDLEELFSDGDHVQILNRLLNSCHGAFNISYLPIGVEKLPQLGEFQHRKFHSLMLLKVLQTIRFYWQERKKLSRQNRGTGIKPHCRLQELTISLRPFAEYKDIPLPDEININNCVGPCRFPQTTQSDYQTHVVLLIQLQERSQSALARPPCCVPVRYEEQWLMVVDENGIRIQSYPNMVAKECGCR